MTKREALVQRVMELEGRMHEAVGFGDPQGWLGTDVTMAQARALVLLRHAGPLRFVTQVGRPIQHHRHPHTPRPGHRPPA